jgi:hypothetical protein
MKMILVVMAASLPALLAHAGEPAGSWTPLAM